MTRKEAFVKAMPLTNRVKHRIFEMYWLPCPSVSTVDPTAFSSIKESTMDAMTRNPEGMAENSPAFQRREPVGEA